MYVGMTAGSWLHIGTRGIVQGSCDILAEAGRQNFAGDLTGRWIVTGGLCGMGGAPPLVAGMAGACCLAVEGDETRLDFRLRTRHPDAKARTLDGALAPIAGWTAKGGTKSVDILGIAPEIFPEPLARRKTGGMHPGIVTVQTWAHDPLNGHVPAGCSVAEHRARRETGPEVVERAARASMRNQTVAMVGFWEAGVFTLDYGNNNRQVALDEDLGEAFAFPGFVPGCIRPLFCGRIGPFRGSRCRAIRSISVPPMRR